MTRKATIVTAIAALAIAAWWLWPDSSPSEQAATKDPAAEPRATGRASPDLSDGRGGARLPDLAELHGEQFRRGRFQGPAGRVHGRVLDITTKKLVPYVDVVFRDAGVEVTANSGDDGRYAVELPPGSYQVRAVGDAVLGVEQPPLMVGAIREALEFDIAVQRLATIRGRVVDEAGRGVSGAQVEYGPVTRLQKDHKKLGDWHASVSTGANGRFELDVIAAGDVHIDARADGRRGHAYLQQVFPGSERADIVIQLDGGVVITGVVLDPGGSPVPGAAVQAHMRNAPAHMTERHDVTADQAGRFAFERMISGSVTMEASAPGYASSKPASRKLAPGSEATFELRLEPARAIAGRVLSADGTPQGFVTVTAKRQGSHLRPVRAATASDGSFAIDGLGAGRYTVEARTDDHASASVAGVEPPAENVELRLSGSGGLRGYVSTPQGRPVQEFAVRIDRFAPPGGPPRPDGKAQRFFADDGEFVIYPAAPGTYDLIISAPGFAPGKKRGVRVPSGGYGDGSIALSDGGAIAGRVVSAKTRQPVTAAKVTALGHGGFAHAFTAADGRFELANVKPGSRSVTVAHPRFLARSIELEVTPGDGAVAEVALTPKVGDKRGAEVDGIGVVLVESGERIVVRAVIPGSPAAEAGLTRNDELMAVDGAQAKDWRLEDAVERLRGSAGSKVQLEVSRNDQRQQFELTRARVVADSVPRGLLARLVGGFRVPFYG